MASVQVTGPGYGLVPSHYLNQCRNTANCTQEHISVNFFLWNSNISIEQNAFEHFVCKSLAIFLWPHCDNCWMASTTKMPHLSFSGYDPNMFVLCMHSAGKSYKLNSLAPWKFEWNFRYVIFQGILVIDGWGISCEIAQIWMSVDFTDDQSTLVQVMAWCRQATSHHLNQCWPRSLMPYGITRPQWVNSWSREALVAYYWFINSSLYYHDGKIKSLMINLRTLPL